MVVVEQSAQSFTTADRSLGAGHLLTIAREQKHITLPLMVTLPMKMHDVFSEHTPQGGLSQQYQL